MNKEFWSGKRVFLTGHTGFKGSWLALWLKRLGAHVVGYALAPPTQPNLYEMAAVRDGLAGSHEADICDLATLTGAMEKAEPEIIFHLAAQSLVRESYDDPCTTFASNLTGTVNVLEAARGLESLQAILIVTTDKCYQNSERVYNYRENDTLGGADPYSASKACAELATAAYQSSFFSKPDGSSPRIATARAGNVIGGGDWAADRLVPDCIRAFEAGEAVTLRNPATIRPWQHVLEPLMGYLRLAELLCGSNGNAYAESWNFGPNQGGEAKVSEIANGVARIWGNSAKIIVGEKDVTRAEGVLLRLDSTKARVKLGWSPVWSFAETLVESVEWYRAVRDGADAHALTVAQIEKYETAHANLENGPG